MSWDRCPHCVERLIPLPAYGLAECDTCGGAFIFEEGDRLGPDSIRPVSLDPQLLRQSEFRQGERKRGQGTVE